MDAYDEERVLTDYIWNNHRALIHRMEGAAAHIALFDEKMKSSPHSRNSRQLELTYSIMKIDDPEAARRELAGRSYHEYRTLVRQRVLARNPDLRVHVCSACNKILRSPSTRLCEWCNFDGNERWESA